MKLRSLEQADVPACAELLASLPDRRFYLAEGFDPLYESLTEWGPQNAALVLVRAV